MAGNYAIIDAQTGEEVVVLDNDFSIFKDVWTVRDADDGSAQRQPHGVDADGEFAFSGAECKPWFGERVGENYTVAGNLLTGEAVIEATAAAYEEAAPPVGSTDDVDRPLAERLIEALSAGHAEGGDKREDLPVQSAALLVRSTEERAIDPYYDDLRVDATETPIDDLRATYEQAVRGFEMALDRYEDDYDQDELDAE